jgi:hypothetical protein
VKPFDPKEYADGYTKTDRRAGDFAAPDQIDRSSLFPHLEAETGRYKDKKAPGFIVFLLFYMYTI